MGFWEMKVKITFEGSREGFGKMDSSIFGEATIPHFRGPSVLNCQTV